MRIRFEPQWREQSHLSRISAPAFPTEWRCARSRCPAVCPRECNHMPPCIGAPLADSKMREGHLAHGRRRPPPIRIEATMLTDKINVSVLVLICG